MNIFQQFFAYLRLREAVRKADQAYRNTGTRHYVMPGANRTLIVMDRKNFRILKRKGYIPSKAMTHDAVLESFYFTPHRDGSGWLTETDRRKKVTQYYSWYAAQLKAEKEKQKAEQEKKKTDKRKLKLKKKTR